ncbi:toll/interleukin-1 receptor domain-containing protein [Cryptosporangium aurantiacum]|uniref:TIR domain-containing protein n=1 Tax=Cryptosporangium aurantiacum TaxID=134849 RepID=A0A1M7R2H1_9ACTN|nr:toll/interleukin-1 receptor domain-containing protein [Cryptosporangium aurantiacum]SHN38754.1 TIR domain-containing protein [Cryptosporangium aurantiacum]
MDAAAKRWDVFVSYTGADERWAEWIAWTLQESGRSVLFQKWHMVPGMRWAARMAEGMRGAERTVAVYSKAYLESPHGAVEAEAAYIRDARGSDRRLIPVRIEDCPRSGIFDGIVGIDLFDRDTEDDARRALIDGVRAAEQGSAPPPRRPDWPTRKPPEPTAAHPAFPRGGAGAKRLTEAAFLDRVRNSDYPAGYADALEKLFADLRTLGLTFEWGTAGASLRLRFPGRAEPVSVGWIFTREPGWYGLRDLTLGFDPATAASLPNATPALDAYLAALSEVSDAVRTPKLEAYRFAPDVVVAEQRTIVETVRSLRAALPTAPTIATDSPPRVSAKPERGSAVFEDAIAFAPADQQKELHRLLGWARELERDGLAELSTSAGQGRWVLRLHVAGQRRGLVALWNDHGPALSPFRSVLADVAPRTLALLDERIPGDVRQGNYVTAPLDDEVLDLVRAAYLEAAKG